MHVHQQQQLQREHLSVLVLHLPSGHPRLETGENWWGWDRDLIQLKTFQAGLNNILLVVSISRINLDWSNLSFPLQWMNITFILILVQIKTRNYKNIAIFWEPLLYFVSDQVCLSVVASISKIVNECCVGTIVILTHMITLSYVSTPDTRRHWQLYKWVFGRVLIPTGICQITLCIQFQIQDNNKVYSCWVSPRYSIELTRFSLTGHLT